MSPRTIKTNPAYANLAYRKAIIHNIIYRLKRDCVGDSALPPKDTIVAEDVYAVDAEVPIEEIALFIEELVDQKEALELEMAKFEFVKKKPTPEQKAPHEQAVTTKESKSHKGSSKPSGKTGGQV